MDWARLEQDFRVQCADTVEPYFFKSSDVQQWLREAEEQAAIRGRLLHESDDPTLCEIPVRAGEGSYPLHALVYEITWLAFAASGEATPVALIAPEELDRIRPSWRLLTGRPEFAIQTDSALRLVPKPDVDGTLHLEAYRLPHGRTNPEIHRAHRLRLVDWALARAFRVPDSETFAPQKAEAFEQAFTAYFGRLPDCDLRRSTRDDLPQTNKAAWI